MTNKSPTLFIHVGLHKTGSTLLQQHVFPHFAGLEYMGRPYRPSVHFIEAVCWSRAPAQLISSETFPGRLLDAYRTDLDYATLQLEGFRRLAAVFPQAFLILCVRSHASWILSCYKHYLKYGGVRKLQEFFSLDGNGLMKIDDFKIAERVETVNALFPGRVFVFGFEALVADTENTIASLGTFLGHKYAGSLKLPVSNEGVDQRQANILRWLNSFVGSSIRSERWLRRIYGHTYRLASHPILRGNKAVRFSSQEYSAIRQCYREDAFLVMNMLNVGQEAFRKASLDD